MLKHIVVNHIKNHDIVILGLNEAYFKKLAIPYKDVIKSIRPKSETFALGGFKIELGKLYSLCSVDKVDMDLIKKVLIPFQKRYQNPIGCTECHFCYAVKGSTKLERGIAPDHISGSYGTAVVGGIHYTLGDQLNCVLAILNYPTHLAIFATTKNSYNVDLDKEYLDQPEYYNYIPLTDDND
jgi:hypothetical protein